MRLDNELLSVALKESERENRVLKGVIQACREVSDEIEKARRWDFIERDMPGVYRAMKKFLILQNQAPYQFFLQGAAGIKRGPLNEGASYHLEKHHGIHECNGQGQKLSL